MIEGMLWDLLKLILSFIAIVIGVIIFVWFNDVGIFYFYRIFPKKKNRALLLLLLAPSLSFVFLIAVIHEMIYPQYLYLQRKELSLITIYFGFILFLEMLSTVLLPFCAFYLSYKYWKRIKDTDKIQNL